MKRPLYYIDSSALVKLVLPETESKALLDIVRGSMLVSSEIVDVELRRAAIKTGLITELEDDIEHLLSSIDRVRLDQEIKLAAGRSMPKELRALDAIHLATAQAHMERIDSALCYDKHLSGAFEQSGLSVSAPC